MPEIERGSRGDPYDYPTTPSPRAPPLLNQEGSRVAQSVVLSHSAVLNMMNMHCIINTRRLAQSVCLLHSAVRSLINMQSNSNTV